MPKTLIVIEFQDIIKHLFPAISLNLITDNEIVTRI